MTDASPPLGLDYHGLLGSTAASPEASGSFAAAVTTEWCAQYADATRWTPEIVEFTLGPITYLFDLAPSQLEDPRGADDRVVGVYGRTTSPARPRERSRQAGFLPDPARWSAAGYDRGHFVAHTLGGGLDVNFFPQARELNRGWSKPGVRWRALERRAARPGAFLLVRPVYDSPSWVPRWLEFGVLADGELQMERFHNRPQASNCAP